METGLLIFYACADNHAALLRCIKDWDQHKRDIYKRHFPYRNVNVVTSLLQGSLVAERLLQPVCQVVTTLHCGCHSDLQPCKIVAATLRLVVHFVTTCLQPCKR